MPEEPQFNGRLASLIRNMTESSGWNTREELWNALRGPKTKPDILITRHDGPPIVIEVEYPPFTGLIGDCMRVIGRNLDPKVTYGTGTVQNVIAVRADNNLKNAPNGDQAFQMLAAGHPIEYAAYQGSSPENCTRFPEAGFIQGSVMDLVDFLKPATQNLELLESATIAFEEGVQDTAAMILELAKDSNAGQAIGEKLRQPWPAYPEAPPKTSNQRKQERADLSAREQTAKMTATMLINAMAYQQNLASHSAVVKVNGHEETRTIQSLGNIRKPTGYHPDDIIKEWENILSINYWAIFHVAIELLKLIPPAHTTSLLERMVSTANEIQDAIQMNDVAGTVFQRLIADRQTLATYYTRPESTVLAAYLAIPEDKNWSDPEVVKNFTIADYACGTGGLLLAAYQRVRDLHRNHGGNPDSLHPHMMEQAITACDIMPAAVHLTSSLLSSVLPKVRYTGSRHVLYPYGATPILDNQGNWIVETNSKGQPRKYQNGDLMYRMDTHIGSLELLNIQSTTHQAVLPLTQDIALGATSEKAQIEVEMSPLSQELVIMNPPFTTPTNHAADHAKTDNPAFAAFGTTKDQQNAMAAKTKKLSAKTIADGYAGLGSNFAAIAHNMLRPGAHIALILPMSSMLGGSYDGKITRSWQKLRQLLSQYYNDILIVSIAQNDDIDASFSADTEMGEVIIIARRLYPGERANSVAHFINLKERPPSKLAAMETAKAIKRICNTLTEPDTPVSISIGDREVGEVQLETVSPTKKWRNCRIARGTIANTLRELEKGFLILPQRPDPIELPITTLGNLGKVGPVHRSFDEAFSRKDGANSGTEWPILWNRNEQQNCMEAAADSSGTIKTGKQKQALQLWDRTSNLHISAECRFNSNGTAANFTEKKTAGGRAWPNFQMDSTEMEKAACAWMNSTLGMMGYWMESNRSQSGRGGTTVTAIPNIPVLDLRKLTKDKLTIAATIYDDMGKKLMLPANEAYRDEVRQELDRRILTEILELNQDTLEQLAILRNQWCMEPTVQGMKDTGPTN